MSIIGRFLAASLWIIAVIPLAHAQGAFPPARWDSQPGGPQWTAAAHASVQALGATLINTVPQDIGTYCPAYPRLDASNRRAFWVYLMSAVAKFESKYKPETSFQENFKDAQGNWVISRGLLQISKESANGYGCGIVDATVLHDPATNIACGVRIMARWIGEDGSIARLENSRWRGLARYWSPFRKSDRRATIATWTKQQPYCAP